MRKSLFVFLGLLLLGTVLVQAQVSFYSFASSSGTYSEISGGTILATGAVDDNNYNANNIGFTFVYNGAPYTQFSVNANGFLALGASVSSSYSAISGGTSNNVIVANNQDLQGNVAGEIRYELQGITPNQVMTIQWKDFRYYGATGDSYNFQIKLYETSNVAQIVYGSFTQNATGRTPQVGIRGASSADFNNRTTTTDWSATTAGAVNTATCTLSSTIFPASGLTFTWTPPPPCTGTPAPGNTLSSINPVCPGNNFILSLQNLTPGTSVTYQWQSSPDGAVWSNIGTSTTTHTATQTAATYYQCLVTCSGNTTASTPLLVNMRTLCYCSSAAASSSFEYIGGVVVTGGINNTGTNHSLYSDYSAMVSTAPQGTVLNVEVSKGTTSWYASDSVFIFIDFNQDGDFTDLGELAGWAGGSSSPYVINIPIPLTATLGTTGMRVKFGDVAGTIALDSLPCQAGYTYGETEDYSLLITAVPSCFPSTSIAINNITHISAELSWTTGGATIWNIQYGPAGFTPGTGTIVHNVTINPYTVSGLNPTTSYDCYIQDSCGVNDNSTWAGPLTFATTCAPVAVLPWTENFDGVVVPAFPSCWTYENGDWVTTNNADDTYDADARSGTQFLRAEWGATNEFIWTPGFELTAGTSYDFSFWWAGDDYDDWTGDVFFNSAASSIGATQIGVSFVIPATVTDTIYREFKESFVPATTGVYYFAIRVNATTVPYFLSFDDFRMELTPVTDIAVYQTDIDLCDTLGLFTPPIYIFNTGNTVIPNGQNLDISYQVDGGAVVVNTITLTADLSPAGNTMVFFTTPYLFNQFVTYSCMMAASLTGDLIQTNDTADFNLSFYHNPTVNLGHDTTLCSNETIILDAGNPGATYNWWNGSNTQIHPVDSTYIGGVGTGFFWVNVEDIHGCSSRDTIYITWSICTGIDQIENISMTIMPNPTNGLFNVDFGGLIGSTYVEISDLTGKVAISETLKLTGIERASYDLSSYAKGIYNIRIVNNSQVAVRKIVVN